MGAPRRCWTHRHRRGRGLWTWSPRKQAERGREQRKQGHPRPDDPSARQLVMDKGDVGGPHNRVLFSHKGGAALTPARVQTNLEDIR